MRLVRGRRHPSRRGILGAHGVKVPAPVTRRGVRTTIRNLPSAQRSTVITACQTQIDALLAMRPGH